MSQFNSRIAGAVLSTLIGLSLAACGGGGDDDGAGNPPPGSGGSGGSTNAAPTIAGQPGASVLTSQAYSFQPNANDPEGAALTFTATNVPSWASFNASTGSLTGTPTGADVGTYANITITVSDGTRTASIGPFSITVADVATGSATLSWVPPTENSDGSTLTNLAGYEILYGTSGSNLSHSVTLNNPSLSVYVVENLSAGTWYFAVRAVSASGATSALSNTASKTIG